MKKLVIYNCPACEAVNRLVQDLSAKGFEIIESKLEDYHFRQLYLKVNAKLSDIKDFNFLGFTTSDNFLICDCHWSRIEFLKESIQVA